MSNFGAAQTQMLKLSNWPLNCPVLAPVLCTVLLSNEWQLYLWQGKKKSNSLSVLQKTQPVSLGRSFNLDVVNVEMDQSCPYEKLSFKMLELFFSSKLDLGSYIVDSVGKNASKKIRALIHLEKFLLRFLSTL